MKPEIFLRFEFAEVDIRSGEPKGIFTVAYTLLREPTTSVLEHNELQEILHWFDSNVPAPRKFSRKRNSYHKDTKGISWMKSSAKEAVSKLYELKEIVERHGFHFEVVKTKSPGYVVYEDDYQIVAEPFSDSK